MATQIITTCTDRKRLRATPELRASSLTPASMVDLAAEWLSRVASAEEMKPAREVYCGRSFQEAEAAARLAGSELAILSAGLGLVSASQDIPGYGLTLVKGASDDIKARCVDEFSASTWWSLVSAGNSVSLTRLIRENAQGLTVLGLSSSYAKLVEEELAALSGAERSRLRIIGQSISRELPPNLREYVLPYDHRLDGPDSPCKGTRSDFSSRAVRHFVVNVLREGAQGSIADHKRAVSEVIGGWAPPAPVARRSLPDAEIVAVIRSRLSVVGQTSGRMLRYLRDVELIACEQSRFKGLFRLALEGRSP